MARTLSFVPTSAAGTLVPYSEIPEDVISDMEEALTALGESSGRIHAKFDNEAEKATFSQYAASWAAQRPNGKVVFRWSPTRGNQKNEGDFTLKRDTSGNGEQANADANAAQVTPPAE